MKWRIQVAMALMWPGVPVSDWATMLPAVSKTPQARSCDSRTTVEKAVRISAAFCSLVTDSSRLHNPSRAIGSMVIRIEPGDPRLQAWGGMALRAQHG